MPGLAWTLRSRAKPPATCQLHGRFPAPRCLPWSFLLREVVILYSPVRPSSFQGSSLPCDLTSLVNVKEELLIFQLVQLSAC